MIYDQIGSIKETAQDLKDKLDVNLPNDTTQANYDILKAIYGY